MVHQKGRGQCRQEAEKKRWLSRVARLEDAIESVYMSFAGLRGCGLEWCTIKKVENIYKNYEDSMVLTTKNITNFQFQQSRLPRHSRHKLRHDLPIKRIGSANRIRVQRARTRGVDVETRPVHTSLDRLRSAREDVVLIQTHDVPNIEVIPIHAELFEHAGFIRRGAGVVVVFEPLKAIRWACGTRIGGGG